MYKLNIILVLALIASISCSDSDMTKEEISALSRDGNARINPDGLFQGFLAAWPVVLFVLAAACLVVAFLGGFAHVTGICRAPKGTHQPLAQEA